MFLCRNLLSNDKQHIDHITNIYGKQLMQAVVFILESENNPEVGRLDIPAGNSLEGGGGEIGHNH
jgi:hypothetical protein